MFKEKNSCKKEETSKKFFERHSAKISLGFFRYFSKSWGQIFDKNFHSKKNLRKSPQSLFFYEMETFVKEMNEWMKTDQDIMDYARTELCYFVKASLQIN